MTAAQQVGMVVLTILAFARPALGQEGPVSEESFHGRRAFVLQNDKMRITELPGGGFIGEVRFKSTDPKLSVNPMRVPHYQTIDPYSYEIAKNGDAYGTGMQRRLMSGYMGHFLAFPQFAASSDAEFNQDYGQHGEALAVEWVRSATVDRSSPALSLSAELPKTQYHLERSILLPAGETVAYVTETVENLVPYDRPMQWVQHVTFGPPFVSLNKTFADGSVKNVLAGGSRSNATLAPWPQGEPGSPADKRSFTGTSSVWMTDSSKRYVYFTMYNEDYKVLIGYLFDSASNPWILDWQENQHMTEKPWDGRVVARGICIGNSVIGGLRNAVSTGSLFGVPTYGWVEARQRLTQHYAIFLAQIPTGFRGVADLTAENGKIAITERQTGRRIELSSAHLW